MASRAERGEANARIFAADGSLLNTFEVGDGVEQIAGASDGRIWIGYFDEGIFLAGKNADGSWPPASSGLAAFDANGECQWRFASEGYYIDDCYAVSASGPTVWACTYQDFPIIRRDETGVRRWKNGVAGAHAIAGRGDHVILGGGYNDDKNRVALLRLDTVEALLVAEFRLPSVAGNPRFTRGRDGILHAVTGDLWLRIDIENWLTARD